MNKNISQMACNPLNRMQKQIYLEIIDGCTFKISGQNVTVIYKEEGHLNVINLGNVSQSTVNVTGGSTTNYIQVYGNITFFNAEFQSGLLAFDARNCNNLTNVEIPCNSNLDAIFVSNSIISQLIVLGSGVLSTEENATLFANGLPAAKSGFQPGIGVMEADTGLTTAVQNIITGKGWTIVFY